MYETIEAKSEIIIYSFLKIFICVILLNILNVLIEWKWGENSKTIRILIHTIVLFMFLTMVYMRKIAAIDITDLPIFFIIIPMISTLVKAMISYSACGYCITKIRIALKRQDVSSNDIEKDLQDLYKNATEYLSDLAKVKNLLDKVSQSDRNQCQKYINYIQQEHLSIESFESRILAIIDVVKIPFILFNNITTGFWKYVFFVLSSLLILYLCHIFMPESVIFVAVYLASGFLFTAWNKLGEMPTDPMKSIDVCLCALICGDLYQGIQRSYKNYIDIKNLNRP
jgi:hypothetical protein